MGVRLKEILTREDKAAIYMRSIGIPTIAQSSRPVPEGEDIGKMQMRAFDTAQNAYRVARRIGNMARRGFNTIPIKPIRVEDMLIGSEKKEVK